MTTQFLTETVTTPVNYNCDVLVCGGGTAGVTAALAAARNGAKTMLVEHGGYVGGTLVNGAGPLHSFFNLYNAYPEAGKHQVVRGIAQEIVEKLQARGESTGHMEQKRGGNYDSVITLRAIRRWRWKCCRRQAFSCCCIRMWFLYARRTTVFTMLSFKTNPAARQSAQRL